MLTVCCYCDFSRPLSILFSIICLLPPVFVVIYYLCESFPDLSASCLFLNNDQIVFVDPLKNHNHNAVCAVNLLIIHALRHGLVNATSLSDLLAMTLRHPSRTVQWTYPVKLHLQPYIMLGALPGRPIRGQLSRDP